MSDSKGTDYWFEQFSKGERPPDEVIIEWQKKAFWGCTSATDSPDRQRHERIWILAQEVLECRCAKASKEGEDGVR